MAKICLCLTGKTLARNLALIDTYRKYIDLAELRVDCLDPDEHFYIRRFPEQAGLPVILTIRRKIDGGRFDSGEGARITLLSRGMAFAESDRRRNFAYVDMEEDLEAPGLEEAVRTFGTRIIRSHHNLTGVGGIGEKIRSLLRTGDEIAKAAVSPQNFGDVAAIYRAAKESPGGQKIILGMGNFGINTRILAERLGSFLCYTSAGEEENLPFAAPGHLSPRDLVEQYRFRDINSATAVYGIVGYPLSTTYSPRIFNTVFNHEKINAVYLPFPSDTLGGFLDLAEELGIPGVSVTIPYKEEVIEHLSGGSEPVRLAGACNTIKFISPGFVSPGTDREGPEHSGWNGINTDTQGFSESLLCFMGKKNFRGQKVTIIGAGGAARAAAAEVFRLRGKCLILNRNPGRARDLALAFGFRWAGLDSGALDLMERYSDIIIQTTPAGTFPNTDDDPFELYHFNGRETVMDMIYNPPRTAFLRRAEKAGARVLNGFDMLIRQAKYQYQYFFERDFPDELIPRLSAALGQ